MQKLDQKWPFLVRFGLNLGLNNLKFDQEAIFEVNSIESIRSGRSAIGSIRDQVDRVDPRSGRSGRSAIGSIRDRVDPRSGRSAIGSIRSSRFDWKWLPGQILSCLDLNWVQIGPKMAIFGPDRSNRKWLPGWILSCLVQFLHFCNSLITSLTNI